MGLMWTHVANTYAYEDNLDSSLSHVTYMHDVVNQS